MNSTKMFFRASTAEKDFEEFELTIPSREFSEAEWELFKKMLPIALLQAFPPEEESNEMKMKTNVTADLEVTKAA